MAPFDHRIEEVRPSKTDINLVVLDYLINEGFPEAAQKFADEANIYLSPDDSEHIQERVDLRNNILGGRIQPAIEQINELSPELLEENMALHFSLLRLQLTELIRSCTKDVDLAPVLEFAQNQIAPLASRDPSFLLDLEHTMALLIHPAGKLPPPLQPLLNPALRVKVADRVNEALLKEMGCSGVSRLKQLARLRTWSERKARANNLEITPSGLDLWGTGSSNGERSNGSTDVAMAA